MGKNFELATRLGILKIADRHPDSISKTSDTLPRGQVCVISTGPKATPCRLSPHGDRDNKWLRIEENDAVVISAHPIPGNEWSGRNGDR